MYERQDSLFALYGEYVSLCEDTGRVPAGSADWDIWFFELNALRGVSPPEETTQ